MLRRCCGLLRRTLRWSRVFRDFLLVIQWQYLVWVRSLDSVRRMAIGYGHLDDRP